MSASRTDRTTKKGQRRELAATAKKKEKFLKVLAEKPNVSWAARVSRLSKDTLYFWRAEDEQFRAKWDQALVEGIDVLEGQVMKRALQSSDTLAIFLLKAHLPGKYNPASRAQVEDMMRSNQTFKSFLAAVTTLMQKFIPRDKWRDAVEVFRDITTGATPTLPGLTAQVFSEVEQRDEKGPTR